MGMQSSKHKVLLLGLQDAGKTTLLYSWRLGRETVTAHCEPTKGITFEQISHLYKNREYQFSVWDINGNLDLVDLWLHCARTLQPNVIIYVVDANNKANINQARRQFLNIIHEPEARNAIKIIVSNVKNANESKMDIQEVRDRMLCDPISHEEPKEYDGIITQEVDLMEFAALERMINYLCNFLATKEDAVGTIQ